MKGGVNHLHEFEVSKIIVLAIILEPKTWWVLVFKREFPFIWVLIIVWHLLCGHLRLVLIEFSRKFLEGIVLVSLRLANKQLSPSSVLKDVPIQLNLFTITVRQVFCLIASRIFFWRFFCEKHSFSYFVGHHFWHLCLTWYF